MMSGEVVPASKVLDAKIHHALLDGERVLSDDQKTLNIPISVRGQTIATMRLVKPSEAGPWTSDEINEIEVLSAQLSNTLDSARLYREAQQRAAREQAIGELSAQISTASEVETILQTVAEELGRRLPGASGVSIAMNEVLE